MKRTKFFFLCCLLGSITAPHAALFEDGDARKQINALSESLRNNQRAVLELSVTNDKLTRENQDLRGQIEELRSKSEQLTKNNADMANSLKSYYAELNARLKLIEPQSIDIEGVKGSVYPFEKEAYDNALKDFQNADMTSASKSFSDFINRYPKSPYEPLANYWLVNSLYAQKEYKLCITLAQGFVKKYPQHPRVPETQWTVANCLLESGQKIEARKAFDLLIKSFPNTKVAENAAATLSKIK